MASNKINKAKKSEVLEDISRALSCIDRNLAVASHEPGGICGTLKTIALSAIEIANEYKRCTDLVKESTELQRAYFERYVRDSDWHRQLAEKKNAPKPKCEKCMEPAHEGVSCRFARKVRAASI